MPLRTCGWGGGNQEPGPAAGLRTPDVELLADKDNKAKFYSQKRRLCCRCLSWEWVAFGDRKCGPQEDFRGIKGIHGQQALARWQRQGSSYDQN